MGPHFSMNWQELRMKMVSSPTVPSWTNCAARHKSFSQSKSKDLLTFSKEHVEVVGGSGLWFASSLSRKFAKVDHVLGLACLPSKVDHVLLWLWLPRRRNRGRGLQ